MSSLAAPLREGAAHIENRSSILVRSRISRFFVQIFLPRWGRKCDPPPGVKQKSPKASPNQGRGVIGEPSRREPRASRERAKRLPGESRERAAREPKGFPEGAASEPRESQKASRSEPRASQKASRSEPRASREKAKRDFPERAGEEPGDKRELLYQYFATTALLLTTLLLLY
jgi:hypothetical protein